MSENPAPSVNSWLEDELYQQYLYDSQTVDAGWKRVFESNGHTASQTNGTQTNETNGTNGTQTHTPPPPPQVTSQIAAPPAAPAPGDHLTPLRGPALRIAENMTASLGVPVATSQRVIPVKVIEENRRVINQHRKISYTHLIAWSIVKALEKVPAINQAYSEESGQSYRLMHDHVNLGVAVDVAGKDGSRALKVPCVKNVQSMNFAQFIAAYDDLIARARENKLPWPILKARPSRSPIRERSEPWVRIRG